MISVVDYGLGNLRAFVNIYNQLNIPVQIADSEEKLLESTKIVLPGVGSFDWALSKLEKSGLIGLLENLVLEKKVPVLGVCVGMQIMGTESEEGEKKGLNWIPGQVVKFSSKYAKEKLILPHMGWNHIEDATRLNLVDKKTTGQKFYFLHSYHFVPHDTEHILAQTEYHYRFASVVGKDNIYGVQFHPEKSHNFGIEILKRFSEL
ncbi:MAG: imidazole glycerol phosphate synthase subunit HisH [Gammaproteobacteria bacterium]